MTVSNRQFGVEIEYTGIPRATLRNLLIENSYNCHPRDRGSLEQWSVVYDGSVTDHDNTGGELISPILSGSEGIDKIGKVARLMVRNGAKADKSCGLHVHIDASDLTVDEIKTIAHRYARFEAEIDGFMPKSRRGNYNNYCYSMTGNILEEIDRCQTKEHFADIERYYKVNVAAFYKHGTIEFRQHSGSINAEKIRNWVKFCISFVEESRNIHREVTENFNRAQAAVATMAVPVATVPVATPQISIMNNPNRPADYPIGPVSDNDYLNVRINNRETLSDRHFRYLAYSEQNGLSSRTIRYVIRALIHGIDLNQEQVYTFSTSTVRSAMTALRSAGFRINHTRGTGRYILNIDQPRGIFESSIQDMIFDVNYVDYDTRLRLRREETERERNRPRARYDSSLNDVLFRGMDEEITSFYHERTTEFQETMATSGRNNR